MTMMSLAPGKIRNLPFIPGADFRVENVGDRWIRIHPADQTNTKLGIHADDFGLHNMLDVNE